MDFCIRVSLYALAHACLCLTDEETMRVMEKTYLFMLSPLEASQISLGFTSEGFPSCVAEPCGKTSNACGHMWWGWLKRNTHIIYSSKKESVRLRGQKHTEISLLFVYEDSGSGDFIGHHLPLTRTGWDPEMYIDCIFRQLKLTWRILCVFAELAVILITMFHCFWFSDEMFPKGCFIMNFMTQWVWSDTFIRPQFPIISFIVKNNSAVTVMVATLWNSLCLNELVNS